MDSKRSTLLSGGSAGRRDDRSPPLSSSREPHAREFPGLSRELPQGSGRPLLSGGSARWDDRPPPVSPPLEPHERELQAHPRELPSGASQQRRLPDPLAAVRARLGDDPLGTVRAAATGLWEWVRASIARPSLSRESRAPLWSLLAAVSPLAFARYLAAFFVGVVVTLLWGGIRHADPQPPPVVAATPADVDSVRQSLDRLAAEVSRIKTVEQGILDRVSAPPPPPQPAAVSTRATSQRAGAPSR